jgi:lipopolysaccharide biosynthesis glycosyltransferase
MTNNGILYLNAGHKMLPRLLVSIHSLRKAYHGEATILIMGEYGEEYCRKIADQYSLSVIRINSDLKIRRDYWFEKSRLHLYTPYNNSIFLDSDTIVVQNFDELFDQINEHDFVACQFAQWRSSGRTIGKRLRQWISTDKELVEHTINANIPSVNVGVYGFKKDAELMKHWFDITIKHPNASLPEESTCHLLLTQYKNTIVSGKYNCSCKHDDPTTSDTKIIHYHGRKHCSLDHNLNIKYNGNIWADNWNEVYIDNICDIQNWYNKCGDRNLMYFMRKKKI